MKKTNQDIQLKKYIWAGGMILFAAVVVGIMCLSPDHKAFPSSASEGSQLEIGVQNDSLSDRGSLQTTPRDSSGFVSERNSTEEEFRDSRLSETPSDHSTSSSGKARHVTPKEEVEIQLPQAPILDMDKLPSNSDLMTYNEFQRTYTALHDYLAELEKKYEAEPTEELEKVIQQVKQEMKEVKEKMDKITHGDI